MVGPRRARIVTIGPQPKKTVSQVVIVVDSLYVYTSLVEELVKSKSRQLKEHVYDLERSFFVKWARWFNER